MIIAGKNKLTEFISEGAKLYNGKSLYLFNCSFISEKEMFFKLSLLRTDCIHETMKFKNSPIKLPMINP